MSGVQKFARNLIALTALLMLTFGSFALADTSLRLGAVFPGWDKLGSGAIYDSGVNLGRGYARQLGGFCSLPEVFLRTQSSSIVTAEVFFESYLPFGSDEQVLLRDASQRVSVVSLRFGQDVLTAMFEVRGTGVGLVVCGL